MAAYATKAVKSGRRLCGQQKTKDVLSPLAQARRGFTVSPSPEFSTLDGNEFDEALQDTTQTPVPDQVTFRLDFPAWLSTRTERDQLIIGELMFGERTLDVSQKYQVSQPRISQLRREYLEDWCAFCEPSSRSWCSRCNLRPRLRQTDVAFLRRITLVASPKLLLALRQLRSKR